MGISDDSGEVSCIDIFIIARLAEIHALARIKD
jgi:hypothetical protein